MQPLVLDLFLLRMAQGGELRIVPGRALMARVVRADQSGRGVLSIAGELVEAELPKQVRPGDELRLTVRHVSADKVELSLSDPSARTAAQAASTAIPLPGGATLRIGDPNEDQQANPRTRNADPGTHILSLQYETPALGAVDLLFTLDPRSLSLNLTFAPGPPLDLAREDADELRQTLIQALGRSVELTVSPRREALDVYA